MLRVPGGSVVEPRLTGLSRETTPRLGDFWIDPYEVTNEEFLRFAESGGYSDSTLWQPEISSGGRVLSRRELADLFVDGTGRLGPATWEQGRYRDGAGDYPVTGVSWYESDAYCASVGKELPTVYHWVRVSGNQYLGADITALSNHNSGALTPRGARDGMGPYGTYDTAGNAREWMWNAWQGGRYVLGGSFAQPAYLFDHATVVDPLAREADMGFRCAAYSEGLNPAGPAWDPITFLSRDYLTEPRLSDDVFEVYKSRFDFDRSVPFNDTVEAIDDSPPLWRIEKVGLDTPYDERMRVLLIVPKDVPTPYPTVVFWPGSSAAETPTIDQGIAGEMSWNYFDFILRGGRAVVWPVYYKTYERRDPQIESWVEVTWPDGSNEHVDDVVRWVIDLRRALDYVQSRAEFDLGRLGFYGASWGARMGPIVATVEDRIRVAVLYGGGLPAVQPRPEVDAFHYVPHVTIPVLMLNGQHDAIESYERAQLPMYELLGTPAGQKRHEVFASGHMMPQ